MEDALALLGEGEDCFGWSQHEDMAITLVLNFATESGVIQQVKLMVKSEDFAIS